MEERNDGLVSVKGPRKKAPRGSWSMEQKQQIVAESRVAGARMAEIAQRHGVRVALLSSWRRQLASKLIGTAKTAKFAEVRVKTPAAEGVIEIDLMGGCVRVHGIVDAQMLREVLVVAR